MESIKSIWSVVKNVLSPAKVVPANAAPLAPVDKPGQERVPKIAPASDTADEEPGTTPTAVAVVPLTLQQDLTTPTPSTSPLEAKSPTSNSSPTQLNTPTPFGNTDITRERYNIRVPGKVCTRHFSAQELDQNTPAQEPRNEELRRIPAAPEIAPHAPNQALVTSTSARPVRVVPTNIVRNSAPLNWPKTETR